MKKALSLILILLIAFSLTACGGGKSSGNEIPDVFGINYADAIGILESDGYEVNAVETSVDSISEKLLYPLEKVDKGIVFKIDDYVLDNLGNLNKNYDVFYEGELVSEDKSIVIYYAKEDYVLEKEVASNATTPSTEPSEPDITEEPETLPSVEEPEDDNPSGELVDGMRPEFKEAMDSYEAFYDEYCEFMKKYAANPTDLSLLSEYSDLVSRAADMDEKFAEWDDGEMNDAELKYYLEVSGRITQKLLDVAS